MSNERGDALELARLALRLWGMQTAQSGEYEPKWDKAALVIDSLLLCPECLGEPHKECHDPCCGCHISEAQ